MYLQVFENESKIAEIALTDRPISIGRDKQCDVVLPDLSVSRRHARIERNGNFFVLRDEDSTNGTIVNDQNVRLEVLRQGDLIRIGKYVLRPVLVPRKRGDTSKVRIQGDLRSRRDEEADAASARAADTRDGPGVAAAARGQARDKLLRLYEIQQELGHVDDLTSLLDRSLDRLLQELEADRGCVLLGDFERKGSVDRIEELEPVSVAYRVDGELRTEGEEIVIAQEFLRNAFSSESGVVAAESVDAAPGGAPCQAAAPLISRHQRLGLVYVERQERLDDETLRHLTLLASTISINLSNALLLDEMVREREKLRAVIQGLTDGVIVTDPSFVVVEASSLACELLGEKESPLGRSLFDLIETFETTLPESTLREQVERGGALFQLRRSGDPPRQLTAHVASFRGPDTAFRGNVVFLRDAAEERRLEALKSSFVRRVAHKLRTPLTVIEGNLPLLHTAIQSTSPEYRVLSDIERNSSALCDLVHEFVEFVELETRAPGGAGSLRSQSPERIVRAALDAVREDAQRKKILLSDRVPERLPRVLADASRLGRALENVLNNAVKFSPDGGIVQVDAETTESVLRLAVSDEGPGIPAAHRDAVFQIFSQVEEDPSGDGSGLGLGLAVARQILLEHGGEIQIESPLRPDGRGSRVTLLVPLSSQPDRVDGDLVGTP